MKFDYKTAANLVSGRRVDEATARRFATQARSHFDRAEEYEHQISGLRRELERRESEIAVLKSALLKHEA